MERKAKILYHLLKRIQGSVLFTVLNDDTVIVNGYIANIDSLLLALRSKVISNEKDLNDYLNIRRFDLASNYSDDLLRCYEKAIDSIQSKVALTRTVINQETEDGDGCDKEKEREAFFDLLDCLEFTLSVLEMEREAYSTNWRKNND